MRKPFERFCSNDCIDEYAAISLIKVNDAVSQDKYEYLSRIAKYQKQCEEQLALYEARINTLNDENKQLKERLLKAAATYLA